MFHNAKPNHKSISNQCMARQRMARQRGGALAVAIFIIVVMSILGVAMVRILGDLGRATVSDVYGTRAFAAARSGAELFLTDLFPLDAPVDTSVCSVRDTSIPLDNPFTPTLSQTFAIPGLNSCRAEVACDYLDLGAIDSAYTGTHFRIITRGICDAGDMEYSKQVILEAIDEGN
ncbi:hypothetical protein CWE08_02150 [Aliidiomarina iranensis]|uniref:Type II secretory pathway component n=1 Tax=Aliidiomarina iranensis TaxID=1434071 RepID=A0A432W2M5_9GAMM|nr:hypothetical protein [Aliidiomarina iranensis]RUO23469.1 hypothetical protein CWE08_02150 [Aliidiomarina iranensis]